MAATQQQCPTVRPECEVRFNNIDKQLSDIQGKLDSIDHLLRGNGNAGLVTRLDRVERTIKQITWVAITCLTAVIGLVIQTVWSWFQAK